MKLRQPSRSGPSESTARLVEELYRPEGLLASFIPSRRAKADIVERLGNSGELSIVTDLLPFILRGNEETGQACAAAIAKLTRCLKAEDFGLFDVEVRRGHSPWGSRLQAWYQLTVKDVKHFARFGELSVSLLGVASCHNSGYIREAATRKLGESKSGAELPYLLLRCNDWVAHVRSTAIGLVKSRLEASYIAHFIDWLPLVLRLGKTRRGNHAELLAAIHRLFQETLAYPYLLNGCASNDPLAQRFCYKEALATKRIGDGELFRKALGHEDLQIRLTGIRALETRLPDSGYEELLWSARRNSSARIRLEALRICAERYPERAGVELRDSLLDSNVAVRRMAQYESQKAGIIDLRQFYREQVEKQVGHRLAAAIQGLGETGKPEDAALAERFLANYPTKVRCAALNAIGQLNPAGNMEKFLLALEDEKSSVAREGVRPLLKRVNTIGGQKLWETFGRCRTRQGKRAVLYLVARLSKWESLLYLIKALGEPDEEIVKLSGRYRARLSARWNRSFVTPSVDQANNLREILVTHRFLLGETELRTLEHYLRSC